MYMKEIVTTGFKVKYYFKDKYKTIKHREDGPAVEYTGDYGLFNCYYLNNKQYEEEEYWQIIRFGAFI